MLKNTQRVTDSLTFVANKTSAGFEDMWTAMEYVGPVANSLNMSLEQTSAAVGLLSNNGLEGDKAGTSLRGALTRLLKPTKQSSVAFKELGINLSDFKKGNLDFPTMLDKIKKSTEGMTAAEKSSLIAKAFGTEAQTGMNILVEQGGDALRNLTKETQSATGYTKKLADQMNNSDKNAFKKAKATLEVLSIELGERLLPSLVPIVKEVADLAKKFSDLDPKTQQLIIKMGLATAAIGPTAKALSGLSGVAGNVTGILAKIGAKGAGKLALAGITSEAGAATGAIAGGGGLTAALGGISPILAGISPVALAALGTVGLAGLIFGVTREVEKLQDKRNVFGTINVPDETYKQVKDFEGKVTDLKTATEIFGQIGPKAFKDVEKAIKDMGGAASKDVDAATKKISG
nr:phage tail tape measure protein [Lactococcus fujiensis]